MPVRARSSLVGSIKSGMQVHVLGLAHLLKKPCDMHHCSAKSPCMSCTEGCWLAKARVT